MNGKILQEYVNKHGFNLKYQDFHEDSLYWNAGTVR